LTNHIREIRGAAERAAAVTDQLLAFSRRHRLEPRIVEINTHITNIERSLLRLLGENISIVCHLHHHPRGAHIKVDTEQLTQVLLNLAVNAREAMSGGGQLEIQTSVVRLRQPPENADGENFKPGAYVLIRISDSGVGMTDEVKAHLFEPFFSTKSDGSGLGLATSYGIICQSVGLITVESELKRGTAVNIYLPKVEPVAHPARKAGQLPRGNERILVLEDDISVRHLSVRVLRSLGYDVIEAASGNDAKRWMKQNQCKKLHLLLTDMVMPQMSGRRFADWMREASPETRVVFVSGYLHESLHPGERPAGDTFFLPKPFSPEQLARTVRTALDVPEVSEAAQERKSRAR
jgi:CheY-like chemotaxis protein